MLYSLTATAGAPKGRVLPKQFIARIDDLADRWYFLPGAVTTDPSTGVKVIEPGRQDKASRAL